MTRPVMAPVATEALKGKPFRPSLRALAPRPRGGDQGATLCPECLSFIPSREREGRLRADPAAMSAAGFLKSSPAASALVFRGCRPAHDAQKRSKGGIPCII